MSRSRRRSAALLIVVLVAPLLLGARVVWDPVTTDITGATLLPSDLPVTYTVYTRKAGSADPWIKIAETTATESPIPTSSSRNEYSATARAVVGEESAHSNIAVARPEAPGGVRAIK